MPALTAATILGGVGFARDVVPAPNPDLISDKVQPLAGGGAPDGDKFREREIVNAKQCLDHFRQKSASDLSLTPRGIAMLCVMAVLRDFTSVVDLQLELEKHGVIIPLASLHALLVSLMDIGYVARQDVPNAKPSGRPKAYYGVTRIGRRAVELAHDVANFQNAQKPEA